MSKNNTDMRIAMVSLEGETGKKVFDEIRATETNDKSRIAANEIKERILASERNNLSRDVQS